MHMYNKHVRCTYPRYRVSHIKLDRVNEPYYDFGDKSENLRRMNHFEKFNKANMNFFLQKMLDFLSSMYVRQRLEIV